MNEKGLTEFLLRYKNGDISESEVVDALRHLSYEDVGGYARVDHHRHLRQGMPEVIYCPGKSREQISGIARAMIAKGSDILATRAGIEIFNDLRQISTDAIFYQASGAVVIKKDTQPGTGLIMVVSAGTSDLPVAEEAVVTAQFMGSNVEYLYDVGVAGIHRLMDNIRNIRQARAVIVAAGMDGALPSVVGGLISAPVIAVPTSTGYGANFGGLAPLLSMLNSCAPGIGVVNIDNGFGAGTLAHKINVIAERQGEGGDFL